MCKTKQFAIIMLVFVFIIACIGAGYAANDKANQGQGNAYGKDKEKDNNAGGNAGGGSTGGSTDVGSGGLAPVGASGDITGYYYDPNTGVLIARYGNFPPGQME